MNIDPNSLLNLVQRSVFDDPTGVMIQQRVMAQFTDFIQKTDLSKNSKQSLMELLVVIAMKFVSIWTRVAVCPGCTCWADSVLRPHTAQPAPSTPTIAAKGQGEVKGWLTSVNQRPWIRSPKTESPSSLATSGAFFCSPVICYARTVTSWSPK
jgi:hypothetical protein